MRKLIKLFKFILQSPGLILAIFPYSFNKEIVDSDLERLSCGGGKVFDIKPLQK